MICDWTLEYDAAGEHFRVQFISYKGMWNCVSVTHIPFVGGSGEIVPITEAIDSRPWDPKAAYAEEFAKLAQDQRIAEISTAAANEYQRTKETGLLRSRAPERAFGTKLLIDTNEPTHLPAQLELAYWAARRRFFGTVEQRTVCDRLKFFHVVGSATRSRQRDTLIRRRSTLSSTAHKAHQALALVRRLYANGSAPQGRHSDCAPPKTMIG